MNNDIIIAYKVNNGKLPAGSAYPFAFVTENKGGFTWMKWIEKIELSGDPNRKGYWEQRRYSNAGDLNGSCFSF